MSNFILDCLNCSRITALSDRLNSLEAKVWPVSKSWYDLGGGFDNFLYVFLYQVQLLAAPTATSHRHLQGKGGTVPEASLLKGSAPAQGAPGEQGPAGKSSCYA